MRASTIAKAILVAAAVAAGLYFLYLIRTVIGALVIAVFLAVALGPAVDFFQRRGIPRALAILVTYLALLVSIFGIGLLVVPPIVSQVNGFVESVPRYVTDLRKSPTLRAYDDRYEIIEKLRTQAENLPDRLGGAVEALRDVTVGVFSALFAVVTILVMTFFLLLDGRRIVRWVERELGPERGPRVREIAEDVYGAVGGYVTGMLAIATLAGVSTYLVLTLLGVPFAVPLAVLMAFLDLIPLIGATIAAAIIGVAAAVTNFPTALVIWLAYFIIYQQVENNITQPLVFRRTVELAPLVVIVSVLIGASLLGVLGAILAIPIAAAVQILVKDFWRARKDRVGAPTEDRAPPPPFAPAPAVRAAARAAARGDDAADRPPSGGEVAPSPATAPPPPGTGPAPPPETAHA